MKITNAAWSLAIAFVLPLVSATTSEAQPARALAPRADVIISDSLQQLLSLSEQLLSLSQLLTAQPLVLGASALGNNVQAVNEDDIFGSDDVAASTTTLSFVSATTTDSDLASAFATAAATAAPTSSFDANAQDADKAALAQSANAAIQSQRVELQASKVALAQSANAAIQSQRIELQASKALKADADNAAIQEQRIQDKANKALGAGAQQARFKKLRRQHKPML